MGCEKFQSTKITVSRPGSRSPSRKPALSACCATLFLIPLHSLSLSLFPSFSSSLFLSLSLSHLSSLLPQAPSSLAPSPSPPQPVCSPQITQECFTDPLLLSRVSEPVPSQHPLASYQPYFLTTSPTPFPRTHHLALPTPTSRPLTTSHHLFPSYHLFPYSAFCSPPISTRP
ncbi:hypothetical protein CLIB1423_01S08702 [[Candida] railenensis]|uniref:Uncharacterized protein n=1 Tax=[Candida] railenensis TaxID=45579 RepID=A0A9P0QKL1_9ASCO|nr:hypothetical protein CLIB1423_01S08702 [[Candida] railenensis]